MFTFSPMPHDAAAKRIADLPLVSREVMDNLLPELRAYAFTVSGLDVGDQMARVRDTLKAVPLGEKNWDKARKEIAAELDDALGGKVAQRRAELLLRTHVFRGYAAARYRNLIAQIDIFPWWQYKTHGDGNVRPSHAALNGKIFPAGHEIWQTIFPPWDWGCRCLVTALTKRAAGLVMDRGRLSDKAAKDANLLPTQIATPEMFSDYEAGLIAKNGRLPNGVPLNRTPTWADSPWSETGSVQHDWQLIRKRYADQPEVLKAFENWAKDTEIPELDMTVDEWIGADGADIRRMVRAYKKRIFAPLDAALAKQGAQAAKAVAAQVVTKAAVKRVARPVVKAAVKATGTQIVPHMTQREIEQAAVAQVDAMSLEQIKSEADAYAEKIKLPKSVREGIQRSRGKGEARSRAIQSRMAAVRAESEKLNLELAKKRGTLDVPENDDSDLKPARPLGGLKK